MQVVCKGIYWDLASGAEGLLEFEVAFELHILNAFEAIFTINDVRT